MDSLFIIAGCGVPGTSRPWTVAEARNELLIIDSSTLSEDARKLFNELYSYLFVEDRDTIALTATLSPEVYIHTNPEYNREEYWVYGYEKRNHAASISLDNSIHGLYGHLELSGGRGLVGGGDASSAVTIKEYVESMGKTWGGIGTLVDKSEGEYKVITSLKNYSDS